MCSALCMHRLPPPTPPLHSRPPPYLPPLPPPTSPPTSPPYLPPYLPALPPPNPPVPPPTSKVGGGDFVRYVYSQE